MAGKLYSWPKEKGNTFQLISYLENQNEKGESVNDEKKNASKQDWIALLLLSSMTLQDQNSRAALIVQSYKGSHLYLHFCY